MPTRRLSGTATAASDPDNGGDHSGGGGGGTYVDDVFSTYLYEGNGTGQDIVNGIDLAGEGGLIWSKARSIAHDHGLVDTERGRAGGYIQTQDTSPQQTWPNATQDFLSFNSDGYSVGVKYTGSWNSSGDDYASWTFRKAKNFFDVVTYTGDGVAGREIPHNLGIEPGMVIVKNVTSAIKWFVWHRDAVGTGAYAYLNETDPFRAGGSGVFSDVGMTSTTFGLGTDEGTNGVSGDTYVAYLFAHDDSDESMIKCGSYTGNQTAGKQIDLGFEPQFVLIKASSGTGEWYMFDTMRGIVTGGFDPFLRANMSAAESGAYEQLEVNPTGFSLSADINVNTNNKDYIYMAIRRPNKPADEFEADDLFAVDTMGSTGDGKAPAFRSDLPIDMAIRSDTSGTRHELASRLTSGSWLYTDQTAAESSINDYADFDFQDGWSNSGITLSNYISHMWRRAPGFFDVVAYEGDGSEGRSVPHNLGAFPELIIAKVRSRDGAWFVRHNDTAGGLLLNTNEQAQPYYWNDTDTPTDEFFKVSRNYAANMPDEQYIAYLFASVPGISKVGSYTGNGGSPQGIDCGFTAGARVVLMKRTDSTGDWYLVRIAADNNSKSICLNNTNAEVIKNQVRSWPEGFRVLSDPDLNIDGAEYIFYAIA